jgi:hypothetical protein
MQPTVTISKDQLDRIEQSLRNLERAISRLLAKAEEGDTFSQLVNSQAFEAHKQATIALFHKDPSRFVDPFETFQKND